MLSATLPRLYHHRISPPCKRQWTSRSLGVCRVYRRIREERKRDAEGHPDSQYVMPHIEQFKMGGDWHISTKEWHIIKRMADKLFPEGAINWEEFWYRDDYDEWYDEWRHLLEEEGQSSATSSRTTGVM